MSNLSIYPSKSLASWRDSDLFGEGFKQKAISFEEANLNVEIQPNITLSVRAKEGQTVNTYDLNQHATALGKMFDSKCHTIGGKLIANA
jgi:hypothetical protein